MFQGPRQSSWIETHLLTDTAVMQFEKCLIDVKGSKSGLGSAAKVRCVHMG